MSDLVMGVSILLLLAALTMMTAQYDHPTGLLWLMVGVTALQGFSLIREVRLGRRRRE